MFLEADALDEVVDGGVARDGFQLRLVEPHGIYQMVKYRERRPQRVELLHISRYRAVLCQGKRSAVDANMTAWHAALLFERQHVEQRRLACARRAEDGQHAAGIDAA
eukprot:scaffold709_cov76-Phaeocystis_antarctica.AAC.4